MNFNFCAPVTWSDIIAMVSSVMTFITAVVAIIISVKGNRFSKKQLQASQQQLNDTIKIHEQSKNMELYDKRLNIVNAICKNVDIDYIEVELLFSKELSEKAKNIIALNNTVNDLMGMINDVKLSSEIDYSSYNDVLEATMEQSFKNQLDMFTSNYLEFCSSYDIELFDISIDKIVEIQKRIEEQSSVNKAHKEKLITALKEYIKKSLEPINKKEE